MGNGDQVCEKQGAGTYWGPNTGQKEVTFGEFQKISSDEPAIQILYLTYSILGTWFVNFVHKNKICPKMAPLGDVSFYIGLYREIHLKRPLSETTYLT